MTEVFYKQIKKEKAFNLWCSAKNKSHAILILGDAIKCLAAAEVALAELMGAQFLSHGLKMKPHTDIDIIKEGTETITVDIIRNLKLSAGKKACLLPYRICIINGADRMNIQAQNALLKLLEEPPTDTRFIFTARSKNAFLKTLLSRLIKINLAPISPFECKQIIIDKFKVEPKEAEELSNIFDGLFSEAIECLTKEDNMKLLKLAEQFGENIESSDFYSLAAKLDSILNQEDFARFLCYLKCILMYKFKSNKKMNNINEIVDVINITLEHLGKNANFGLTVSYFIVLLLQVKMAR
ncbi:MAG: hypothetical protein ACI4PK_02925 [Oscillospiraceae bacterium]